MNVIEKTMHFAALFDGRDDAYGLGHGEVKREQVTMRLYQDHLEGKQPIGIFPVREDNTVLFAAVDIDEPNFELARDIADFLPAECWIEESRSGNYHVWVFFDEACPAWVAQANLRLATEAAGQPRVEVFPKQAQLLPQMVGNYINLPYFGAGRKMVWFSQMEDLTKRSIVIEDFISYAEAWLAEVVLWERLALSAGYGPPGSVAAGKEEFGMRETLHQCATYMLEHKDDNPLSDGHRHVVLFNLAKMILNCRNYSEDEAVEIVKGYNEASTDPLSEGEIESLVANAARGEYTSTGCDDPLMAPYVDPSCPIANA